MYKKNIVSVPHKETQGIKFNYMGSRTN